MQYQRRPWEVGVIHGRFQVLHNDHLKYLLAGKALCRHLVVGITNPDPWGTRPESADPARSDPLANPLTYYERYRMLQAVLQARGITAESFSVVPLPINLPERYRFYVPLNAVFFLSIYDDWGRQLYVCALGVTGRRESAEDAVHNAFCRLLNLRSTPENLKAYAFKSVRNAAVDQVRMRSGIETMPLASPRHRIPQRNVFALGGGYFGDVRRPPASSTSCDLACLV